MNNRNLKLILLDAIASITILYFSFLIRFDFYLPDEFKFIFFKSESSKLTLIFITKGFREYFLLDQKLYLLFSLETLYTLLIKTLHHQLIEGKYALNSLEHS